MRWAAGRGGPLERAGSLRIAAWIAALALAFGSFAVFPVHAVAPQDLIVDLGTLPGDDSSVALGLNESGAIVGWSGLDYGFQGKRGFLWENGTMKDLGSLGGTQGTWATDINEAGQIVGSSYNATNYERPFLWENGSMTDLDVGAAYGGATAINDFGQVVGYRQVRTNDPNDPYALRAFVWKAGKVNDLGTLPGFRDSYATGINNAGQVVGYIQDPRIQGPVHAFLWENGTMKDLGTLPGDALSQAADINEAGQVVGWSGGYGETHAFLSEAGSMRSLAGPANATDAQGINDVGQVVGLNGTAVVWHDGNETGLGSLVPGGSSIAHEVNNAGAAVGEGRTGAGTSHAVLWPQVVPIHDVAVTASALNPYPTVGETVPIDVVGENRGNRPETFDLAVAVGPYPVGRTTVTLAPSASTTVRFEWNTTGIPPGTYSLNATAGPVPGETNLADNAFRNEGAIIVFLRLEAVPSASPSVTEIGLPVQFACDKTDRAAPFGPYSFSWAFGDGNGTTGDRASHAYTTPGLKIATCTVTEGDGENASASVAVRVGPGPSVQVRADRTAASPGTPIRFSATASGGSGPYRFDWAFGDGATVAGADVAHAYAAPGNYIVTVSVNDSLGSTGNPLPIPINVSFIAALASTSARESVTGESILFMATSQGGAGPPYRYLWDFGDGTTKEGEPASHVYARPGTYVPRLTVTDAAGASADFLLAPITIRGGPSSEAFAVDADSTRIILGVLVVATVAGAVLSVRGRKPPVGKEPREPPQV